MHSHQFDILVSELDKTKLILLIKGLCKFEEYPDMQFGSTTRIKYLVCKLEGDSDYPELIDWLFANRKNPYIPYGSHITLDMKSEAEYLDYQKRGAEHRNNMLSFDRKNHLEAVERKRKNMEEHIKRHKDKI